MRFQENIYVQTPILRNRVLGVNTSSDMCIFVEPTFDISGSTKIITGITSADTGVHIITTATTIDVTFDFTGNTDSFLFDNTTFKYEIYKYNTDKGVFSQPAIYKSDELEWFTGITFSCPSGYTINPNNDGCTKIENTGVTASTTIYTATTIPTGVTSYCKFGANFYENIDSKTFPIGDAGNFGPLADDNGTGTTLTVEANVVSLLWGNNTITSGRLNNAGIWATTVVPINEFIGFSYCLDIPVGGVYTMGICGDNYVRIKVNGVQIVNIDQWQTNFHYWHVFPLTFDSGLNIIELEGANAGSDAAFGAEIYSATTAQLSAMTTTSELSAVTIFSTLNQIGLPFDLGENSGYSCPTDYALDLCDTGNTICTKIIKTGITETIVQSFSGYSGTTQSIPINTLGLDGEYLIKGYFVHDVCTEFSNLLGDRLDSSMFKTGDNYNIYDEQRDFYFIATTKASKPSFDDFAATTQPLGALTQKVIIPTNGQTTFSLPQISGNIIITLNGLVLAPNEDYTISSGLAILSATTLSSDTLTLIYSNSSVAELKSDVIDISAPISSGATNTEGVNEVFFNTTSGKYEVYTSIEPRADSVLLVVNGITLANQIDYYRSTSNAKRLILEDVLKVGDIVVIIYIPIATLFNGVSIATPMISWKIPILPQLDNGNFLVEVASDETFGALVSTATSNYIIGQGLYNAEVTVTGSVGTELYYRIKNEKNYATILGENITSVEYSDVIPIIIQTNSINTY